MGHAPVVGNLEGWVGKLGDIAAIARKLGQQATKKRRERIWRGVYALFVANHAMELEITIVAGVPRKPVRGNPPGETKRD